MNRVSMALLLGLALPGCYTGLSTDAVATFGDPGLDSGPDGSGGDGDGDSGEPDDSGPSAQCADVDARLPPSLRGLNSRQFANTIAAVFPGVEAPTDLFWDSDRSSDYSTRAGIRRLDFKTTSELVGLAEDISVEAAGVLQTSYPCLQEASVPAGCVSGVLEEVTGKLYRMPAPAEHLASLEGLFDEAAAATSTEQALQFVVRAMLNSPRFLFRTELGALQPDGTRRLTQHEVAEALAYTLTDAPPDDALRAAAEQGQLETAEQLEAQARRLLESETGTQGMLSFVSEFTGLINFSLVSKDEEAYPEFNDAIKEAMLADFNATTDALLRSDTPTLEHLLTSDAYVVSELVAQYLGWDQASSAGDLVPVGEADRRGLLTHPAMMAAYAHEEETNPVARGHFISDHLLCFKIEPPAEAVTFPDRDEVGQDETLRETLERIHSVSACAGCHALMDPYGWPFEVFDATGRLRSLDRGQPIDPKTEIMIPGGYSGPIDDVAQLLDVTAEAETVHVCVNDSLFSYVAGHGPDATESFDCLTEGLGEDFVADGDLPAQVVRILSSPAFLERSE